MGAYREPASGSSLSDLSSDNDRLRRQNILLRRLVLCLSVCFGMSGFVAFSGPVRHPESPVAYSNVIIFLVVLSWFLVLVTLLIFRSLDAHGARPSRGAGACLRCGEPRWAR